MRSQTLRLLLAFGLAWAVANAAQASESFFANAEWEPSSNRDGVEVLTWKPKDLGCTAFQGRGVSAGSVGKSLSLIQDVARRTVWFPMVSEARKLAQVSPLSWTEAWHMDTPIGVSDREVVFQLSINYDPATKTLVMPYQSVEHAPIFFRDAREKTGPYTRARIVAGEFRVRPTQVGVSEGIEVVYRLCFDMGGTVSPWLVNSFLASYPRRVILGMWKEGARAEVADNPRVHALFTGKSLLKEFL